MSKKTDIYFLLHFPPPVHGSSLVGQYIKESLAINETFKCRYANLLASRVVNETGKVSLSKLSGFFGIWFRLISDLIRNRPELCYFALTVTGTAFFRDVLLVTMLKLFGIRTVYHLHNKGIDRLQRYWVHRLLYRYVFKGAHVILLSKYLYSDIKDFVSGDQVFICPNGIPIEANENKRLTKTEDDPVNILFLSNLIESKGVFVLLEACSVLKKKGLLFHCNFVGGEGDVSKLQFQEKATELGLTNFVSYHGEKYDNEKIQAFVEADIFALPTYYLSECLPLVLLEAMKYKLPIISTDEGGIKDVVDNGGTGFLVKQRDVKSLADKLELLIRNQDLRSRMGTAGYQKYLHEFTMDKFENRLIEILNKIIHQE